MPDCSGRGLDRRRGVPPADQDASSSRAARQGVTSPSGGTSPPGEVGGGPGPGHQAGRLVEKAVAVVVTDLVLLVMVLDIEQDVRRVMQSLRTVLAAA